jgi:hypothetical protein
MPSCWISHTQTLNGVLSTFAAAATQLPSAAHDVCRLPQPSELGNPHAGAREGAASHRDWLLGERSHPFLAAAIQFLTSLLTKSGEAAKTRCNKQGGWQQGTPHAHCCTQLHSSGTPNPDNTRLCYNWLPSTLRPSCTWPPMHGLCWQHLVTEAPAHSFPRGTVLPRQLCVLSSLRLASSCLQFASTTELDPTMQLAACKLHDCTCTCYGHGMPIANASHMPTQGKDCASGKSTSQSVHDYTACSAVLQGEKV